MQKTELFYKSKAYLLSVRPRHKKSTTLQFTTLFLEHIPYLAVLVAYLVIGSVVGKFLGRDCFLDTRWRYEIITSLTYLSFLCFLFIQVILIFTRIVANFIKIQTGQARKKIQNLEKLITIKRLGGFIIVFATIPLFLGVFSNIKQSIPLVYPFTWDRFFMKLDRVLHGGHHPWILLQPFLGYPAVTKAIDYFYVSGFYLYLLSCYGWDGAINGGSEPSSSKLRPGLDNYRNGFSNPLFFRGPMLLFGCNRRANPWTVDVVSRLHSQNDFLMQGSIKKAYGNPTRKHQPAIWRNLCMLSVHVATAVLFALAGWVQTAPRHRLTGYALVIQIGSVHLGWHYAVDGYFSAMLTYLIWKLADLVLKGLGGVQRGIGVGS
jgi:hypothetical protein